MLVPADAFSGAERFGDFRLVLHAGCNDCNNAGQKHGAHFVRQRHGLLGRQRVCSGCGVVGDESAGSLRREPFADVALGGSRFCGEFGRGHRPRAGHRFVESQFVADDDQRRIHRRSHFADGLHHEFVQLCFVERLGAGADIAFLLGHASLEKSAAIGGESTRADLASQSVGNPPILPGVLLFSR